MPAPIAGGIQTRCCRKYCTPPANSVASQFVGAPRPAHRIRTPAPALPRGWGMRRLRKAPKVNDHAAATSHEARKRREGSTASRTTVSGHLSLKVGRLGILRRGRRPWAIREAMVVVIRPRFLTLIPLVCRPRDWRIHWSCHNVVSVRRRAAWLHGATW